MATWAEFEAAAPAIAAAGRELLYQFGPGLAFLATVRGDGGPRVHPICPAILNGHLYAFIGKSPKQRDLLRDGRYALHTFPPREADDEFYVTGRAAEVRDQARRARVSQAQASLGVSVGDTRPGAGDTPELLFEFHIERALHAAYQARGAEGWPPSYTTWHQS